VPASVALVLGDQLTRDHPALVDLDPATDTVLMIEAAGEATHVWSHKARIALFLSAMRHFAQSLAADGLPVRYIALDDPALRDSDAPGLDARLDAALRALAATRLVVCEPGDWRVVGLIRDVCKRLGVALEIREDTHFIATRATFADWARGLKSLRMEFFYRRMRQQTGVLMDGDQPTGGRWNFDEDNRESFGRDGPRDVPAPPRYPPDAITRDVIALVERTFPDHPGSLASFAWPVTRADALDALQRFVDERLGRFGAHQDAMWIGEPFLWHSLLSPALNLKLLDPREVIAAAQAAWHEHGLPLASVEGFIRQILGWREFMRGVYWHEMPKLALDNHFGHERPLPAWYWTGDTQMRCQREAIGQTLEHGYAHHIQRLMVTGNFALLAQIRPQAVEDWYLAVYVDAVDWVELPNVAGMTLFANGGRFTSKPYVASGAYIKRMSNYCKGCRYDPSVRSGPRACPFTVLYWGFLDRHEKSFAANPRTSLMAKNIARLGPDERAALRTEAARVADGLDRL
jgi:deoxyribodipyrimidine photolyase-related protein